LINALDDIRKAARIGFVGGGQLAMMTAEEAQQMRTRSSGRIDMTINILDPSPNCPAHRFSARQIVADFKDVGGIERLAEISDILTYEIELGNAEALVKLRDKGVRILPSPETLRIIQDKHTQKDFLRSRGIPVPRQVEIATPEDLRVQLKDFGYPAMLKSRRDSYDGRGNYLIRLPEDVSDALRFLSGRSLMLEEFMRWDREVSVIAARSANGEVATFPVGENAHRDNILEMTIMPARISRETSAEAERVARLAVGALADYGVFGIEMFECAGRILVNEVAPRVHNTGHGTLEQGAFETSQFEQHLRAITGLPLGNTSMKRAVVMRNILGDEDGYVGPYSVEGIDEAEKIPGVRVHMYGKEEVRPKRKMGHLAVVGGEEAASGGKGLYDERAMEELIARAVHARELIKMRRLNQNA
jgi:5-(carboxyamino)imidazole ribonucleotide synthase